MNRMRFFLLLGIIADLQVSVFSRMRDLEHQLIIDLFQNYSKEVRPALNKTGEAVLVEFDLAYSQLVSLDSKNQILSSKIWIRQFWNNTFLMWNPKQYGGIEFINISPHLVWKPDMVLYNSLQSDSGEMDKFNTKVQIYYNGRTKWFAPTNVKTVCKIDITYFPFDDQHCKLVFGSWTYAGNYLDLRLVREAADLSGYTISGEWDLKSATAVRNVVKYSCCPDPYLDITYTIHTRRRVLFYLTNLIFPCVALGVLVIFAFFLPPESGERVSMVITILLGFTVYTLIFTENIPPTSEVMPLLTKYSTVIMVELGFSLVASCLMLYVFHRDPEVDIPGWVEVLVFGCLAKLLRIHFPNEKRIENVNQSNGNLAVGFQNKNRRGSLSPYLPLCRRTSTSEISRNECTCARTSAKTDGLCANCLEKKLGNLSVKLDNITEQLSKDDLLEKRKRRWQQVAQILDTFFFWMFVLTMTTSTFGLYLLIPSW